MALILHVSDVCPILEDGVELAAGKSRHGISVVDALLVKTVLKTIEGQMMVCV